jgi:hypothetical protein
MVATVGVPEVQVRLGSVAAVLPSVLVPLAVNVVVVPPAMLFVAGVTVIDLSTGAVTVSAAVPETPLKLAVMVEVPVATAVASPAELMVAVAVVPEVQVTLDVMTFVELSLYVPVAVNCAVVPAAILSVAGVTAIELKVGGGGVVLPLSEPPPPQAARQSMSAPSVPWANDERRATRRAIDEIISIDEYIGYIPAISCLNHRNRADQHSNPAAMMAWTAGINKEIVLKISPGRPAWNTRASW